MGKAHGDANLDVIYDGQCSFCQRSLAVLQRLAGRPLFRLHDANDQARMRSMFPMLAETDTNQAMFVVTPQREVFEGFFAYRRMIGESPRLYLLRLIFYAPGASFLGPLIYAWVARNRRNLGCSMDEPERCGGHPGRKRSAAPRPSRRGASLERGEICH